MSFLRELYLSEAVAEMNKNTFALIVFIVTQEDRFRYRQPVHLWNSQVEKALGFRSDKQISAAKKEASEQGWLKYFAISKRHETHYFVSSPITSENGSSDTSITSENGSETRRITSAVTSEIGSETGEITSTITSSITSENGSPHYLVFQDRVFHPPVSNKPIQNHTNGNVHSHCANVGEVNVVSVKSDFERFWGNYPAGKRSGKVEAERAWGQAMRRLRHKECPHEVGWVEYIIRRAKSYSESYLGKSQYAKRPSVFLDNGHYDDANNVWMEGDKTRGARYIPKDLLCEGDGEM